MVLAPLEGSEAAALIAEEAIMKQVPAISKEFETAGEKRKRARSSRARFSDSQDSP
jgi:hypothetical protein